MEKSKRQMLSEMLKGNAELVEANDKHWSASYIKQVYECFKKNGNGIVEAVLMNNWFLSRNEENGYKLALK